jgi:3'-phosphoadenosine 5'-phosphosulfate sulfotransferase (PAPS reductase)/FAD synthetase
MIDPHDWSARNRRLDALLASIDPILDMAVRKHIIEARDGKGQTRELAATITLFSGGNDSIVLAHLMRTRTDFFGHANTGIGVEATRAFVRKTCAEWGVPLLEREPKPGRTYRDYVRERGMPGPADHGTVFNRIKGSAFEQMTAELVGNPYRRRVLLVAGRRFTESDRRRRRKIPVAERSTSIKSQVWVSPLRGWTSLDLLTYRHRFPDCPRNPVADALHMSGECLCGANAHKGEFDELCDWSVYTADAVAEIRRCEQIARDAGHAPERCRWGWGAYRSANRQITARAASLCGSCDLRADLARAA